MSSPFTSGPVPAQTNPRITPQYYQPSVFEIANLTRGVQTTIETSSANNYVAGQQLRFVISPFYGTSQMNEQTGFITNVVDTTHFIVNIDSSTFTPFIPSPSFTGSIPPQVMAIGDTNISSTADNLSISGAFQNISPN